MTTAPDKNSLKNTAAAGGVGAIPEIGKAAPTNYAPAQPRHNDRGRLDLVFAGSVSVALWSAIIFIFTLIF